MGIREMRKKEILKRYELAKISGVRSSTIKYYSEIGILPFIQEDKGLARRYKRVSSLLRLREIRKFKKQGYPLRAIIKHFNSRAKNKDL
jgi:DNA-binding transcriptional MerR regulator